MKNIFYYKYYNFILNRNHKQEGFTIPELIISGVVSLIVLLAGFSLLRMNLQINKSDEVNLKLAGKVNSALDFIVDEISISQEVISKTSDIPNGCSLPPGELVLALKIPSKHANEKKSYKTNKFVEANEDCPIIYNLVRNNSYRGKGGPYYILQRKGPSLNEKGYYEINNVKTTNLLDKVRNNFSDVTICGLSSGNKKSIKKQIKGIVLCIDEKGRGAEIMINAESPKINNQLTVTKSSGGYTMINNEDLINSGGTSGGGFPGGCKFFGTCLTTKKFTFFIDVSGSMGNQYSPGKTLMEEAKEQLISLIDAIPVNDDYFLNVFKYSNNAIPVFPRPLSVNQGTKNRAIDFVKGLYADGWTNPFQGLSQGIQEEHVEQMVILSDGVTYDTGTCFHNSQTMKYADCFAQYNEKIRNNDPSIPAYKTKPVKVDTISLKYDFCSGSNIPWTQLWMRSPQRGWFKFTINKVWLGELATKNNGTCKHIK